MHSKKIVKNSIIGITTRLITVLIGFLSRKIFIIFLGEELLGLNSLYYNLLDFLNLIDLGVGVALQYQLYEPLVNRDYILISRILSAAKRVYRIIGILFLLCGIVLSFFVSSLIKETNLSETFIRSTFLVFTVGVSVGYFFAHKRLLFQADEEIGFLNIIDFISRTLITCIALALTVIFQNYYCYLIAYSFYELLSNLIVSLYFKRIYPTVMTTEKEYKSEKKVLTSNLKNVIPMKLSNFVYNSTDNVIIAKIIGLITVARYTNYMSIINGVMMLEYIVGNAVSPSVGKMIKEKKTSQEVYDVFLLYLYVHFVVTNLVTVLFSFLITPFIKLWLGDTYTLGMDVTVLLIVDFYIHSMYQPAYVIYGAAGKFKEDRIITVISAVLNLLFSLVLVNFFGVSGVVIGTLITDVYIWIVRNFQMVVSYFKQSMGSFMLLMFRYLLVSFVSIVLDFFVINLIDYDNALLELLIKLPICLLISVFSTIMLTKNTKQFVILKKFLKKIKNPGEVK